MKLKTKAQSSYSSRFAQHVDRLVELAEQYPTKSGHGIGWSRALKDDPSLKQSLDVHNERDMGSLRAFANSVLRKRQKVALGLNAVATNGTRAKKAPAMAHEDALNYCPRCGCNLLAVRTALMLANLGANT
jgi:hypothetical protein